MPTPAIPLPTVPEPPTPVADTATELAPAQALDVDVDQPIAGIDHFEHDHTGRTGAVVLFTLVAALAAVVGVLATPDVVRVSAFGLSAVLCIVGGRALIRTA